MNDNQMIMIGFVFYFFISIYIRVSQSVYRQEKHGEYEFRAKLHRRPTSSKLAGRRTLSND